MIDLNHSSGAQYVQPRALPNITAALCAAIDAGLSARRDAERPRTYVSSSGLGRACLRQIQYDFQAIPKDEGRILLPKHYGFSRQAIAERIWSRTGCAWPGLICTPSAPMVVSSGFQL